MTPPSVCLPRGSASALNLEKKLKSGEIDHTNADLRQYLTIENGDLTIENEDSKKENDRSTIPINPLYL